MSGSAGRPHRPRCDGAMHMCRNDIRVSVRAPTRRRPCRRRCGRRRASPTPRCAECWKSSTAAARSPSSRPAGRRPCRLGAVGQPTATAAADDGRWRCCAGCGCRRWATTTGSPRPRCSAATAVGAGCTPSPAASNGSPPGAVAGGRAAHRLTALLQPQRRLALARFGLACRPCRRAASRRSRRVPPDTPAGVLPPLPCTCAEPSSAGPV